MSPEHKTKQTNSPSTTSITSFIQEIGFKQDSRNLSHALNC